MPSPAGQLTEKSVEKTPTPIRLPPGNLLLFTMGELRKPSVFSEDRISSIPVIEKAPNISQIETMADPLVQALILTAIVISFGVTAFILVVGYRAQRKFGTDDLDVLRRLKG